MSIALESKRRLSNEIMRLWMARDAAKCPPGELGVDLGAGSMRNRPMFKTRRYIAVDFSEDRLKQGAVVTPEAEVVRARIEDYPLPDKIDLAVCALVMNNKHFNAEFTLPLIGRVIDHLAPGGSFLFNIGYKNQRFEQEIDYLLDANFRDVNKIAYGRFHFKVPVFSRMLVRLIAATPKRCEPSDPAQRLVYYGAIGKL